MRRVLFFLATLAVTSAAHAGSDASISDASIDVSLPDSGVLDGGSADTGTDAEADAGTDAATDAAKPDSGVKDATSDACDPNIEPCTTRADSSTNDAGDNEGSSSNGGGCSCDESPGGFPSPLLLVALGLIARSLRRRT